MIPFDVSPPMYVFGAILIIFALAMFIFCVASYTIKDDFTAISCLIFSLVLLFLAGVVLVPYIMGNVSSQTITICNHQLDPKYVSGVIIMDENGNTYDVYDINIQMRIRDGVKTNVEIASPLGYKSFIYKSDLPVVCGNQTCGVTST